MTLFPIIDKFDGTEYAFLSNFYPSVIYSSWNVCDKSHEPIEYATVEHFYQASKAVSQKDHDYVNAAKTPAEAKRRGRMIEYQMHFESMKNDYMLHGLRLKFKIPELREKLLATDGTYLIEGNTWKDTYWGMYNGKGKNMLGQLLMVVRDEIKE